MDFKLYVVQDTPEYKELGSFLLKNIDFIPQNYNIKIMRLTSQEKEKLRIERNISVPFLTCGKKIIDDIEKIKSAFITKETVVGEEEEFENFIEEAKKCKIENGKVVEEKEEDDIEIKKKLAEKMTLERQKTMTKPVPSSSFPQGGKENRKENRIEKEESIDDYLNDMIRN